MALEPEIWFSAPAKASTFSGDTNRSSKEVIRAVRVQSSMGKVFPKLMILPLTATTMQSVSRMFEHGDGTQQVEGCQEMLMLQKHRTRGGPSGDVIVGEQSFLYGPRSWRPDTQFAPVPVERTLIPQLFYEVA